jgi:hypothetical protein
MFSYLDLFFTVVATTIFFQSKLRLDNDVKDNQGRTGFALSFIIMLLVIFI